jgi:hypothetical protein
MRGGCGRGFEEHTFRPTKERNKIIEVKKKERGGKVVIIIIISFRVRYYTHDSLPPRYLSLNYEHHHEHLVD